VLAIVLAALLTWAPFYQLASGTAPQLASTLTAQEREAAARVSAEAIREVTTALASNEMQGRGTGQPGGDKAAAYLADQFDRLKLKPLGDGGTFLQSIKFKVTDVVPDSSLKAGDNRLMLGDDFVVAPPYSGNRNVSGFLVFVGYGLRNDFNGVDLKNKIVVLIGGPPKNGDEVAWGKANAQRVIITYIFRSGAAGLILTNAGSKRQSYARIADYLMRRRVALAGEPDPPASLPPILYASDQGAEKLFVDSGTTYAQAKQIADRGEPASNTIKRSATITVRLKEEKRAASNVVGLLEGSDPVLKEQAIVYSAHFDAFGLSPDGRVYAGAADNALGVAEMIGIAEAFSRSPERPRRSIVFLAVTGEEYGLLGAEHWVRHPTWKIEKVAANINFDGIGTEVYGPVRHIVGFGLEHSSLGATLESVVTASGNSIVPDPMPDEKAFYRSDHYAFVKKGIPALMLLGAPEGSTTELVARAKKWLETDYHQPTDTVRADWNWEGPRMLAVVGLIVGIRIANEDAMPRWLVSSPFNQPRGTSKTPPPMQ
jgi:Zn-dependent M28 family amino/carboxypeptidase